jgi:hypothetical protein
MPDQLDKKPAASEASSSRVPADAQADTSSVQSSNPSGFVIVLAPNDVLLGRGAFSIGNEGNVRFRQLVQSRKVEYRNTSKRQIKDWIARQVVQAISFKKGRFLRRIESLVEAEQMGVPEGVQVWVPVDEGTIIQKVKQALRDRDTGDEDEIQDVEQRASGGFVAAAEHTQGIVPRGLELDRRFALEGTQQRSILQQRIDMQQQAALRGPSSLSSTIGDFLRARQAEKQEQQAHADHARARASILDAFQGIGGYNPLAMQGNISGYPGGTNNGVLLPPGMAELRNAPAGSSFPMSYQHLLRQDNISSSIGLLPARDVVSTLVGSGIARAPTRASETPSPGKETRGENAIYMALDRAQQLFAGSPPGSYLKTSMIEMLLIRVICSHGLPVWEPPNHKLTDATRIDNAESSNYLLTWSDFGSLLARAAKDWHDWIYSSSDRAVDNNCRTELRATVLAARYEADPEELARKTTSLLEKLRNFMGPDDYGISAWFEQELCRWALTLSITDKQLHPVAYTASDFVSAHPQYTLDDEFKTVCVFDTQSCRHIILQVACMSRLRSVFLSDEGRGIEIKVDEASTRSIRSGGVWKSRPSWWGLSRDAIAHDMALLQSLLAGGFVGVLGELSSAIPESARELGLSKASIQEHMEMLVPHLHESQETADRQAILKGLEAQHFNHSSSSETVATGTSTTPRRNEPAMNFGIKHDETRKTSAERYSGGVDAEHNPANKRLRKN